MLTAALFSLAPSARCLANVSEEIFGSRCSGILTRRAFNYTAPTTWNSIPADILTCDPESGFKRLLKTRLFNNSFNVA